MFYGDVTARAEKSDTSLDRRIFNRQKASFIQKKNLARRQKGMTIGF